MTAAYGASLARLLASPTTPKLGLERMRALLTHLGDPQRAFKSLHVAGTKGKGSTCAFAEAMCRAAGLRTGLTISPHLSCARERIVLDGRMIDERRFVALEREVHAAAVAIQRAHDPPSFFEQMIAMAFCAFRKARVDIAVVEVGLGGRLDATNVLEPIACAITRLGLDHTEHLGPTLAHIAREKAGILKRGVPAVTVAQEPAAARVLDDVARSVGAPLTVVAADAGALRTSLFGAHQIENAAVARALIRAARLPVDDAAVASGAANAVWPGRYEALQLGDSFVVLDGAHNETAARALVDALRSDARAVGGVALVVGMTRGHDVAAFARPFAALPVDEVIAVESRNPRSQRARDVAVAFARAAVPRSRVVGEAPIEDAIHVARTRNAVVVVTGSLYVVGDARVHLFGAPSEPARPLF